MRLAGLTLAVATAIVLTPPALAQGAAPADARIISDCLKKAQSTDGFGGNCIGIVAEPCMERSDKTTDRMRACAARELLVWTALMDAAGKRVKAGGFKDISAAMTESEKSWIQLRDKLCPVFDKVEPGSLPGDAAYCRMQTTAHRALLLRRLGDAVNER